MKLRDRVCPGCQSSETRGRALESSFDTARLDRFSFSSRKLPEFMHHRMVVCARCELLYATPIPDGEWLAVAYHGADFESAAESRYAARSYAALLPDILRGLAERGAALDIGAGDGAFLEELIGAGFDRVRGIEPSRAPVASARPEIRRLIDHGFFPCGDHEPGSFSLISCFQTLEHVEEPMSLFAEARELLEPGGALFTIVHDREALSARLLGTRSPIFDIEHLQLFSRGSIRRLYERFGFDHLRVAPVTNRYPLSYWAKLLPLGDRLKRAVLRPLEATGVGRIPLPLRAGNLVAVGYKPR